MLNLIHYHSLFQLLSLFLLSPFAKGRELQSGFQDVAFLPSRASFCSTFLKNCDRCYDLGTASCLQAVGWMSKGMLPVKSFSYNRSYFLCKCRHVMIKSFHNIEVNVTTSHSGDITGFKTVLPVCQLLDCSDMCLVG